MRRGWDAALGARVSSRSRRHARRSVLFAAEPLWQPTRAAPPLHANAGAEPVRHPERPHAVRAAAFVQVPAAARFGFRTATRRTQSGLDLVRARARRGAARHHVRVPGRSALPERLPRVSFGAAIRGRHARLLVLRRRGRAGDDAVLRRARSVRGLRAARRVTDVVDFALRGGRGVAGRSHGAFVRPIAELLARVEARARLWLRRRIERRALFEESFHVPQSDQPRRGARFSVLG